MRKSVLPSITQEARTSPAQWLDLDSIATAEIESEDPSYPFEDALHEATRTGWKAAAPGPQKIRLIFDQPQVIRRIHLEFLEEATERAQEFVLYAFGSNMERKELVRQQWSFSPGGSSSECEDYSVNLSDVTAIELTIDPGRHDRGKIATLQFFAMT